MAGGDDRLSSNAIIPGPRGPALQLPRLPWPRSLGNQPTNSRSSSRLVLRASARFTVTYFTSAPDQQREAEIEPEVLAVWISQTSPPLRREGPPIKRPTFNEVAGYYCRLLTAFVPPRWTTNDYQVGRSALALQPGSDWRVSAHA